MEAWQTVGLPIALGLLGFIEPCSVAAHGLFAAYLRRRPGAARVAEAVQFALARALVFGGLGLAAGLLGQLVLAMRTAVNLALGIALIGLGLAYAVTGGRLPAGVWSAGRLVPPPDRTRAVPLGLATGLSVPACATPLLAAALASGVSAAGLSRAFLALFLFGAALSIPLAALILWPRATERLSAIGAWTRGWPRVAGALVAALGIVTILFER
jgi:cytochrome c-type biogenesis protein